MLVPKRVLTIFGRYLSSSSRGGPLAFNSIMTTQNSSQAKSGGVFMKQSAPLMRNLSAGKCFLNTNSPSSASSEANDPKLITNEEWAGRLTPEQYFCTREGGTEPPFSGQYYNAKGEGLYNCVCCGSELFSSKSKYDSGCGWPSFSSPITSDGGEATSADSTDTNSNILKRKDVSHGMVRIEVICKNCNAHLGHVFEDGPQPTGERYCINSSCLKFQPKKLSS